MLIEIALAVTIVKGINYIKDRNIRKVEKLFNEIMEVSTIKNKAGKTFTFDKVEKKDYGYKILLNIPVGLSLKHLEDKVNILQDNLNSIIELKKSPFKEKIVMILVNKDISKFIFKPVKQRADQIFVGRNIKNENYFIDLNKDPMILIVGKTGYGKTMLLSSMLTNLIYNCSNDIELWFTQLIKGELSSFDDCKAVKFSAYNENDVCLAVSKIRDKLDKRTQKFKEHGIRNLKQWNNKFPHRKMKRIFLICEEMSELMEYEELWENLWGVVKAGRSVGIHLIGALQRITATNIDTNVRSQMTKISFFQNSEADSRLTLGSKTAMDLLPGECIVGIGGEQKIKVAFIDDDFEVLNKYVPDIRIPTEEARKEVIDINKLKDEEIQIISTPEIIDVEADDIKPVKKIKRKGVISLEEVEDADRKR